MLIIEREGGAIVTSANTVADGVLAALQDYWGDVVAVWDTTTRADHRAACAARADHPGGSLYVDETMGTVTIADADDNTVAIVPVVPVAL